MGVAILRMAVLMDGMLLNCPNCNARYVVPDSAIGPQGRQVRCAGCKNSWFQEGAPDLFERPVEREPLSGGMDDLPPPPQFAAMAGAEAPDEPLRRPRRNPARYWTMAALGFALLVALVIGSNAIYGWMGDGLKLAEVDPPLEIIPDANLDRQTIVKDGKETEYFAASGTIVNPTDEEQPVPPLQIVLYDAQGRKVFDWVAKAKVNTLPPGGRVEFSDAQLDVPRSAAKMDIYWSE
jgi:predicted Zn finger-like uncharacterized protein